jgi:hypothetical protein
MAGGGIGEAMLMSAAIGGGSAAITGGDPLKGALLGGLTGGAGAAFAPALGGMFGGAAPAAAMTTNMAPTVANAAAMNAAAAPAALSGLSGAPGALGSGTFGMLPEAATSFASTAPGIPPLLPNAVAPAAAPAIPGAGSSPSFMEGMSKIAQDPTKYIMDNKYKLGASALAGAIGGREEPEGPEEYNGPLKRYRFNPETYRAAEGGITNLASGGYDRIVGEDSMNPAFMARGGISDLGGYSDYAGGGRMLRGPGDGMSDSIPASIAGRRPARLANEEFVVPADVVSHIGNGSSDAGAKQLYAMMDRIRKARTGRKSQGREINPRRYMPA